MQSSHPLETVGDDELLRRLFALLAGSRHTEADLVAHIAEVDARRLYAREATPSMFVYCTERLHLSEAEACLRIAAARASREHPVVLEMLADGRLHLSAIARLAPHLTPENRDALLRRATHRTKREIDELVAQLSPRPDLPALIRKLPAGRTVPRAALAKPAVGSVPGGLTLQPRPEWGDSGRLDGVETCGGETASEGQPKPEVATAPADERPQDGIAASQVGLSWVAAPAPRPGRIEPLAPARYKVQFTASTELREKLERLQALMRSSVPDGDLAAVIEAVVTEKLERLEARRFGRTKAPRKTVSTTDTSPRTRQMPAAVKRAVHDRDGDRCCYVDAHGNRCPARFRLEYHHRHPFGLGGDHSPDNISLLCRLHNRHLAEIDYGREAVGKQRRASGTFTQVALPDLNDG